MQFDQNSKVTAFQKVAAAKKWPYLESNDGFVSNMLLSS